MIFVERKELDEECDSFIAMMKDCGIDVPSPKDDEEKINLLRSKMAVKKKIIKEYGNDLRNQFSRYTMWMLFICILGYVAVAYK
jgi:hypothetical protein